MAWEATLGSMSTAACALPDVFGALMPLGYAPARVAAATVPSSVTPFLQLAVTQRVCAGTPLLFVFYPHADGYQSPYASTFAFVLTADALPQYTLQLQYVLSDASVPTLALQVVGLSGALDTIAAPASGLAPIAADSSVMLYFGSGPCSLAPARPVAAIGLVLDADTGSPSPPTFPPPCVLPCQFTFALNLPTGQTTVFIDAATDVYVRGAWRTLWQRLRWTSGAALWTTNAALTGDFSSVKLASGLRLALNPGQLVPIQFTPLDATVARAAPAAWAVVASADIPANTTVCLDVDFANNYNTGAPKLPTYRWTTPAFDIVAGTVVQFTNLHAGATPLTNYGTITVLNAFADSIVSIVAVSGALAGTTLAAPFSAATGTFTCAFAGEPPADLVPGQDTRYAPWPNSPSIVLFDACARVCDWACQRVLLNRAPLARYVCQPLPSTILSCKPPGCKTVSCCGGGAPPAFFIRRP